MTPAEWPELVRLDEQQLPEFPTHVLPTVLREWVAAESHATQTPADLAGLLSLAVVSFGFCSFSASPSFSLVQQPKTMRPWGSPFANSMSYSCWWW